MGANYTRELASAMTIRAETVNMAGRNISSFDESNIYGPVKQIPDGITYGEDVNITFIASQDMAERDYIENWQQMIYDAGNWDLNYYNDFIGTIDIYTVSKHNDGGKEGGNIQGPKMIRTFGIRCQEVWPKTLGATEMSNGAGSELIKIPVSFAFRYWDRLDPNAAATEDRQKAEVNLFNVSNFIG